MTFAFRPFDIENSKFIKCRMINPSAEFDNTVQLSRRGSAGLQKKNIRRLVRLHTGHVDVIIPTDDNRRRSSRAGRTGGSSMDYQLLLTTVCVAVGGI